MTEAGYNAEHARSGSGVPHVELTFAEILHGASAGLYRQVENLKKDRKPFYGADNKNDWQKHIEGCLGEMALAKHLGVYWSGKGGFRGPDVADFQVRTSRYPDAHLLLHPDDPDDKTFWLVTGLNGIYDIRGHILGSDGKQQKFWEDRTGNNRWAFFVPQSELR